MPKANTVAALSPDRQQVWQYNGPGPDLEPSWTQIGGAASALYGGGYGLLATDAAQGNLLGYTGTPGNWQQIGGPGAAFAVTVNTVYGLNPPRESVWLYLNSGMNWIKIGGAASEIIAYHGD